MTRSRWIEQTVPMSARSFVTVSLETPVIRHVARMLLPSTSAAMIALRFSRVSLFIPAL
jgi:hypothetical protein